MKALSIRQPWAWLIVNGWKNVENREWSTRFRGRFLVHAGKGMTRADYDACRLFGEAFTALELPPMGALERGGIIGEAVLVDSVRHHESEWFCGPWGFVLDEARPLPFEPCKGALGFFEYKQDSEGDGFELTTKGEGHVCRRTRKEDDDATRLCPGDVYVAGRTGRATDLVGDPCRARRVRRLRVRQNGV